MKAFKSLKKVNEFFEKKLNKIINNAADRPRLPCPYSRVSELILLDKCISVKRKNAIAKLENLLQRHENLIKQIKQENLDLKGIVGRQGRELVTGKVKNVKVLYESEIYLLSLAVENTKLQVENYLQSVEEVEEENKKWMQISQSLKKIDDTEQKQIEKEISQLEMECELLEAEIDELDSNLNSDDNNDSDANSDANSNVNTDVNTDVNSGRLTDIDTNLDSFDVSNEDDNTFYNSENQAPEHIEAKKFIASIQTLPWQVYNIFKKLINE